MILRTRLWSVYGEEQLLGGEVAEFNVDPVSHLFCKILLAKRWAADNINRKSQWEASWAKCLSHTSFLGRQ